MASPDIRKVSILGKESIHCGFHLITYIVETILQTLPSSTYVLITDTNVADLHLPAFQSEFDVAIQNLNAHSKSRLLSFIVPPGEASKSREGKAEIEDFLLLNKCTRDTVILAIGGGVIGDLVGFVAATFMRGVRFVQVPTTLLAMVDSSVGGKTAIDTPHGKNLIGAFWQPEYIFIDAAFLETLPPREFSNGMAEVVKTAAIWKEDDFASLESRSSEIFAAIQTPSRSHSGRSLDNRSVAQQLLLSVIIGSISVKAYIVTIDERETGLRNLVNFGHTIGHAIEAVLTPNILHGECVSIGMVLEAEVARAMRVLSQDAIERLGRCLQGFNLPVSLSDPRISHLPAARSLSTERLLDIMKVDKKNSGPQKKIVILSKVGATYEQKATDVADSIIADILSGPIRALFESIESSDNPGVSSMASNATNHSSVVLIGMRGSGKTFVGKLAAVVLGRAFLDADTLFEAKHHVNVREFVHLRGWPSFREAETELLKELLDTYPTGHVISLGGGIVETPSARAMLKTYARNGPVVYITRKLHEILAYVGEETARPAYDEPVSDVFRRREPWFVECSNYEYVNSTQTRGGTKEGEAPFPSLSLGAITRDVTRFFGHITGESPNLSENLLGDKRSYFLCLTYPDLTPALRDVEALTIGSDAIELRVDLLHSPQNKVESGPYIPPIEYVFDQLAALRQWTNLPIVFTARSVAEGGRFPNSASKEAFELFNMALRHGVEYIDVEMAWPSDLIQALVARKGYSQIVASYHDWSGNLKWNSQVVEEKYRIGASFADIVKIVGKANTIEDNFALHTFVSRKRDSGAKPIIAINMGFEGKISRVLNRTFSPVTHPLLPNKAAPGQLSFTEIQTTLHAIGQLPALRFYHLGDEPNVHSLLPTLQSTAFSALGLPHSIDSYKTNNLKEIISLLASPDFGGASIVPGRKVGEISDLEKISISEEARAIGVVDTIVARRSEDGSCTLFGDNTEWLAIRACITSSFPFSTEIPHSALVLGVGETSRAAIYALQRFGMKTIYLFDETRNTTQNFPDSIKVLDTLGSWPDGGDPPSVVVSTRPLSLGKFYLPAHILTHPLGGVVVDTANTSDTPLLRLAAEVGRGWQTVPGVNVLIEQGFSQLHTWTGRRCPKPPVLIAVQNQTTVVSS